MSRGRWHVSKVSRIYMFYIRQLANRLIDYSFLIVRSLRHAIRALAMLDLMLLRRLVGGTGSATVGAPGRVWPLSMLLKVETWRHCVFL